MNAVHYNKVRKSTPRTSSIPLSINKKLARIQFLLEDLDQKLSFVEGSKLLSLEPEEIFAIYTPIQMEERAVSIVSLFSRSSILLSIYRCELRELMHEYVGADKPGLSEAQITKIGELAAFITHLRGKHINGFGANVNKAFHYRLLSPEEHADVEIDSLELLLIRFFGSANLDSGESLPLSRLEHIIASFGHKTGHPAHAMELIRAVKCLADEPREVSSVPVDAGTWSAKLKQLLVTIQAKVLHLQNDLEEIISELHLEESGQKDLFQKYSLAAIRENASYLYQKFVRGDLLLQCYEAELRFVLMEYDQGALSSALQQSIAATRKTIAIIQQEYIQKYTAKIAIALKQRLGVYEEMDSDAEWLDKYIVYAFDMGMMQAHDTQCPGLQETHELILSLGKLVDKEETAKLLLDSIRSFNF